MSERRYPDGAIYDGDSDEILIILYQALQWALEHQQQSGMKWFTLRTFQRMMGLKPVKVSYRTVREVLGSFGVIQPPTPGHPFSDELGSLL